MIYSEEQKKEHVRELQEYLYAISFYNDNVIRVIPDGIFGTETSLSVRSFQTEYGLLVTGEVNRDTWNKIVSVYRDYVALPPCTIDAFPSTNFILGKERKGSLVYILQAMVKAISLTYGNVPNVNVTGIYDDDTALAVKTIQQVANLNPTGLTNRLTWNVIVMTYSHLSEEFKY